MVAMRVDATLSSSSISYTWQISTCPGATSTLIGCTHEKERSDIDMTLAGCNVAHLCVGRHGDSTIRSLKTGGQVIGQSEGENSRQQLRAFTRES